MKTSMQPAPLTMIDQKQWKNVEYLKYLGSIITKDVRCTSENKSKTATAKAAFNNKTRLFAGKLDLNLRKKLVKQSLVWC
jgi:hypothetical protein